MKYKTIIKDYILNNLEKIIPMGIGILLSIGSFVYVKMNKCEECTLCETSQINVQKEEPDIKEDIKTIKVDVKGAVKNPGVYETYELSTVSDAISLAGGVTSSGVTTNINLSKKLTDEMVIYVFTKKEIQEKISKNKIVCEIPKCECEELVVNSDITTDALASISTENSNIVTNSNEGANNKISINTESIEELMRLEGIGESKAKAIIEYRRINGNFKSIEEIMNVSGIGEKAYEKIKDQITI